MYYLHVSNRTEQLLRQMAELLRVRPQRNLFAPELFLIQSQGMERLVTQTLADQLGTLCNFQFLLPLDFLRFIAEKLQISVEEDNFSRELLTWRFDGLLRDLQGDLWTDVTNYLSGEESSRKRFQFAWRLATIFDEYQVMRPDMLASWEQGKLQTPLASEIWQRELWLRLLAQPEGASHRGELFRQVIETLRKQGEGENTRSAFCLPMRISIFGINTFAPLYLQFLSALSNHMDVHLFLLSPSRNYLGGMKRKRHFHVEAGDEAASSHQHHPLLESMGILGRDFQEMLLREVEPTMEFDGFDEPLTSAEYQHASFLHRMQNDLLEDRLPEIVEQPAGEGDNSIKIVACHSKWRELEVLRDHLLRLLEEDQGLELKDIVVMAPDIQEYEALIPSVFHDIPHNVSDRSQRTENGVVETFLAFLELFGGRFGWSEMFDVLRRSQIAAAFGLEHADFDQLQRWIIDSGIRWGLSFGEGAEPEIPHIDECSWQAGLNRLLMGYAIDRDEEIAGIFPCPEVEGNGALALGGLCHFVATVAGGRQSFRLARTPKEWGDLLFIYIDQLFPDDMDGLVELRKKVTTLAETVVRFHNQEVDFAVVREWLQKTAQERRVGAGFLGGQLTFCSMLPMRSIPFQAVCLLGLDDAVFPARDKNDTFDLMAANRRRGDRLARVDDRYQFLEAILAARTSLYLSYIGRSQRNNEEIPPSVVLTEFIEVLQFYGVKKPEVHHPLHAFSKKYFSSDDNQALFSYSSENYHIAAKLQGENKRLETWLPPVREQEIQTIHLSELLQFISNPQSYFLQNVLGLQLRPGEELPGDTEFFEVDGLRRYLLGSQLLEQQEKGIKDIGSILQQRGQWTLGSIGGLHLAGEQARVDRIRQRIIEQDMGALHEQELFDVQVSGYHLHGSIQIHDNGILISRYGKVRGVDLIKAWLLHCLGLELNSVSKTVLVTPDESVVFEGALSLPGLTDFFELYSDGCREISDFYPEPAAAYAKQALAVRAKKEPIEVAREKLSRTLKGGYDPGLTLLARGRDGDLLGDGFIQLAERIMLPIWRRYEQEI